MFKHFDLLEFLNFINDSSINQQYHKIITDGMMYKDKKITTDVHKCEIEYTKIDDNYINIKIHSYAIIISDIHDFGFHISTIEKMKDMNNSYSELSRFYNIKEYQNNDFFYSKSELHEILDFLINIKKKSIQNVDSELLRMYFTYLVNEVFGNKYEKKID